MDSVKKKGVTSEDIMSSMSDIGSRLRVLEERYANLRKKTQVTDQNMIFTEKNMVKELKEINIKVADLRSSILDMEEHIQTMLGELTSCVRTEDQLVLKKYLELWQPTQFVTRDEAVRIIKEELERNI